MHPLGNLGWTTKNGRVKVKKGTDTPTPLKLNGVDVVPADSYQEVVYK